MRQMLPGLLAPVLCLATAHAAVAVIPLTRPPLAQRVVLADCIITGKVAKLESDLVQAFPPLKIAGAPKIPYCIAVVKVDRVLHGAKDVSELRVGFVPLPARDSRVLPRYRRLALVELTEGEEGCFFLQKHPEESFYVIQAPYHVLDKAREKTYEADVAEIKRCLRLLKDPLAGLKAANADERRLTAALLLFRHRTPVAIYTGKPCTEPVDAEESRLILTALQEYDWSEAAAASQMAPLNLFLRLGLTANDAWTEPAHPKEWPAAAQKWLRENKDSYRIRRYVPEAKTSKQGER
ncbi:MAG TPA: hypothetical protein VGY58_18980 [Gemmataceae bacterium]|nr:hypothetical protein [Gemmataceae bacterium]